MATIKEQTLDNIRNYGLNLVDLETAGTHNGVVSDVGRLIVDYVERDGRRCGPAVSKLATRLIDENPLEEGDTALRVIGEVLRRVLRGREVVERKDMDYSKMISADHALNLEIYDTRQKIAFILYTIRKNKRMSRLKMADILGIKPSRYYRYEIGATYLREEDEMKIEDKMNLSLDDLYDLIIEEKAQGDTGEKRDSKIVGSSD